MKLYAEYDASKDEVISVCMKSPSDPSTLGMFEIMTNRTIEKLEFVELKGTGSLPPVTTGILDGERWFYMELPEVVENQKAGKPE